MQRSAHHAHEDGRWPSFTWPGNKTMRPYHAAPGARMRDMGSCGAATVQRRCSDGAAGF
jgi:hypothetical protein